jgi:hypothetical protein
MTDCEPEQEVRDFSQGNLIVSAPPIVHLKTQAKTAGNMAFLYCWWKS